MKLGDKSFQFKPKGSSIDISAVPKSAQEAAQVDVDNEDNNTQFYNEENVEEEGKGSDHFISVNDENKVDGDPAHGDRAKMLEGNPFLEGAILKVIFKKAIHGMQKFLVRRDLNEINPNFQKFPMIWICERISLVSSASLTIPSTLSTKSTPESPRTLLKTTTRFVSSLNDHSPTLSSLQSNRLLLPSQRPPTTTSKS